VTRKTSIMIVRIGPASRSPDLPLSHGAGAAKTVETLS